MKRIGEILLENKLITREELDRVLEKQKSLTEHKKLGELLIEEGYISYDSLMAYLEEQLKS